MSSNTAFKAPSLHFTRRFLLPLGLLALVLWWHDRTGFDFWIQDAFYLGDQARWIVQKSAKLPRFLFYHGPKIGLIILGCWYLLSLSLPDRFRSRSWVSCRPRIQLIYLLLCLGLFPASIGLLKKTTGLHCPSELVRYGGQHEFRRLFSHRPPGHGDLGHCFPAGHASGGFALLSLYQVSRGASRRRLSLALALGAGWAMGLYQMLTGAHFLSHTVVTMLLAFLFTSTLALALGRLSDSKRPVSFVIGGAAETPNSLGYD
jgi:membrane-associated PAP2 superfamily phosphatase